MEIFGKAKAHGIDWIAVQDNDPDHPNDAFYRDCCLTATAFQMKFGLWMQPPKTDRAIAVCRAVGPHFFIANIENDPERMQFDPHAFRRAHPNLECAVATTGGGFDSVGIGDDPAKAKPFIDMSFDYMGEAYVNENPGATPNALNVRAKHCGWPGASAVLGVYGGFPASRYADRALWPTTPTPWSIYTAETLTPADWVEIARWNGV